MIIMIIPVNAQANNQNVSRNNSSSATTVYRKENKKYRNLKAIFILSLELTISTLVGGALMVAINGMNGGPPMP